MFKVLFLIHGMGAGARPSDDPHWHTEVVAGLRRNARPFGHDKDLVLASPNEVGWLPLLQGLAISDPQALAKLPGWVATAGKFFWTHVLDVLLYRYVADFTVPI